MLGVDAEQHSGEEQEFGALIVPLDVEYYHSLREADPGDVFIRLSPDSPRVDDLLEMCEDLGVTWVLFGDFPSTGSKEENLDRIRGGSPPG